jgi:hypothetical protein
LVYQEINSIGQVEGKANSWNTLFDSGNERPLIGFFAGTNPYGILYVYPNSHSGTTMYSNEWFHLAVSFTSNSDYSVYLNGQKVVANADYSGYNSTTRWTFDFWIGGDLGVESSDSWMSNCRFYNRALTDAEVLQNYNATN